MTTQATIYVAHQSRESVGDFTDPNVRRIAYLTQDVGLDGATITPAIGVWKGSMEASYTVTLLDMDTDPRFIGKVKALARALCQAFSQDCVLVTFQTVDAELIGAS